MDLNDYQEQAKKTAKYPNIGTNINYAVLGLVGEAGEIANDWKKAERDDELFGELTHERAASMSHELGDVLWYVAALASELGYDLNYIAHINLDKLAARKERGVISGEGSNR